MMMHVHIPIDTACLSLLHPSKQTARVVECAIIAHGSERHHHCGKQRSTRCLKAKHGLAKKDRRLKVSKGSLCRKWQSRHAQETCMSARAIGSSAMIITIPRETAINFIALRLAVETSIKFLLISCKAYDCEPLGNAEFCRELRAK